jgi:heme a synthase
MNAIARRRQLARRIALGCAALMFAVTSLSAFVRLANIGLGGAPETDAILMARDTHRIAASIVLLGVIALAVVSLGPRPYLQREGRHALALIALAVFLALIGRFSSGVVTPPIVLGNLLGGFLMFALCWRLALGEPRALAPAAERLAWLALAVVLAQLVFGTLYFMSGQTLGVALAHNVISLLLLAVLLHRLRLPLLDDAQAEAALGSPPAVRPR